MRVGVEERIELPGGQPERQAQSLLQAAPEAVYGLVCAAATPLPALLLLLAPDQV